MKRTFVVRCLDSMISLVSISRISSLSLASVVAQAGLCLTWSHTPKTGFIVISLRERMPKVNQVPHPLPLPILVISALLFTLQEKGRVVPRGGPKTSLRTSI